VELDLGMYSEACGHFKTAIDDTIAKGKHKVAGYYAGHGSAENKLGKYEDAINDYTTAITLGPNVADYYSYRGDPNLGLLTYGEAIKTTLKP